MKQVTEVPEWFKSLPTTAYLKQIEVAKIFNVTSCTITAWRKSGNFPEPMKGFIKETKTGKHLLFQATVCFWTKKVILKEIQRRKEIANATSRD
jgi:hypothetical protein